MAFVTGQKSRILVDTFHLSTVLDKFDSTDDIVILEKTVFTSPAREYLAGITGSEVTGSGFIDTAASSGHLTLLDGWKTADKPVTIGYPGFAVATPVQILSSGVSQFKVSAAADGIAAFDFSASTNGLLDYGVSLHDLAAETDTANGTAVNGGAATANGGIGSLHVVGALTTVTAVDFKIQHSVNGSTSWADLVTFTTATGATSEQIVVAAGTTVRQYTRVAWTATGGPGSFTFQASFARR